jgi:hypothetical protein
MDAWVLSNVSPTLPLARVQPPVVAPLVPSGWVTWGSSCWTRWGERGARGCGWVGGCTRVRVRRGGRGRWRLRLVMPSPCGA